MELNTTEYLIKYAQKDILNQLLIHLNTMGDDSAGYDFSVNHVKAYIKDVLNTL